MIEALDFAIKNIDRIGTIICLIGAIIYQYRINERKDLELEKTRKELHNEILQTVEKLQGKSIDLIKTLNEQIARTNDIFEQNNKNTEMFRSLMKEDITELKTEIKEIRELRSEIKELRDLKPEIKEVQNRITNLRDNFGVCDINKPKRRSYERDV
jgi:chromosome segregation ATPase